MGGELRLKVGLMILYVLLVASTSDGSLILRVKDGNIRSLGQSKMVVGSRPPGCVNKCLSCRPCVATLVVSGRKNFSNQESGLVATRRTPGRDEDYDGYYLLSWKCRCGDKIYQP